MKRKIRLFSILTSEKLYSVASVINAISHDQRSRPVDNADPDRFIHNHWLIGSSGEDLKSKFIGWIDKVDKIQTNAIYGRMLVLSASSNFYRNGRASKYGEHDPDKVRQFEELAKEWAIKTYGDMILYMVCHMDEATCHIHLLIVPITPQNKLSHNQFFGGKKSTMTKLQDAFADYMAPLGLKRGRRFSVATHKRIQDFYELVNSELEPLPEFLEVPKPPGEKPASRLFSTPEEKEAVAEYQKQQLRFENDMQHYQKTLPGEYGKIYQVAKQYQVKAVYGDAAAEQIEDLLDKYSELAIELDTLKNQMNERQPTRLCVVLEDYFGYEPSITYKYQDQSRLYWTRDRSAYVEIDMDRQSWMLDDLGVSGRGALTLVANLLNPQKPSLEDAFVFLVRIGGRKKAESDYLLYLENKMVKQLPAQSPLPLPVLHSTKLLQHLIQLLCGEYSLPEPFIQQLMADQKLSVNQAGNIVFPSSDHSSYFFRSIEEAETGKPRIQRLVPEEANFVYSLLGQNRTIIVVERPLDALAAKAIDPQAGVVCFANPCADQYAKYLVGIDTVIGGFGTESPRVKEVAAGLKLWTEQVGLRYVDQTRLSAQVRYSSWSKLLKDKPNLQGSGVLLKLAAPGGTSAPRLGPSL